MVIGRGFINHGSGLAGNEGMEKEMETTMGFRV